MHLVRWSKFIFARELDNTDCTRQTFPSWSCVFFSFYIFRFRFHFPPCPPTNCSLYDVDFMASAIIRRVVLTVGGLVATAGQTAAVLQGAFEQGLDSETSPFPCAYRPGIPGTKPLIESLDLPAVLERRDCLTNGTNHCFADQAKFCTGCGICCGGSKDYCCASGQRCCGSACCAAGQTCRDGHCFLPV